MGGRKYDGPAVDGTVQYITERPELDKQAEDIIYATDPEDGGEIATEGVPEGVPKGEVQGPDEPGQATLDEFCRRRDS